MKKVLALILTIVTIQNISLASWEHEAMIKSQEYYALTNKYKKISEHLTLDNRKKCHDLRWACEFAPRGWVGKNTIETACDILYKQFDTIDEYVKKAFENNQELDYVGLKKDDKFIEENDAQDLLGVILNSPTNSLVVVEAWNRLNDDYEKYCKRVAIDTSRQKTVSDLSKKYSN